ncbi:PhoH family protein [Moheibacter sediminis]|uniref:PhoH-like protein n=1 Tax=Moheibacter sediminis TaxID=1434700 RepID=A0A1W2CFY6_9FLAO|nr:PhoH family protein [Moheibacter sediminis]SMC83966.1 phosphate starvation-inducible protein PhoH [Moheibacter sediminis]
MTELNLELADVNVQEFYGANNENFKLLKTHFPKLKIVGRGKQVSAVGNEDLLKEFSTKISQIINHIQHYNKLNEKEMETILESENSNQQARIHSNEVLVHGVNGKLVKAMTAGQQKLVDTVRKNDMVFAVGPAGTGKTYTGVALAVQALKNKEVRRIILTRPAVEAGESLGFLPGDLKEKLDPYLQPLYDALKDMIHFEKLESYLEKGIIEVAPLAFMRGRTLDEAFVILDEAQNTTHSQMKMFLTRMGKHAKFIITGDPDQIDLPPKQKSGLKEAMSILDDVEGIGMVILTEKDVVRHKLVGRILHAYKKLDSL